MWTQIVVSDAEQSAMRVLRSGAARGIFSTLTDVK